MSLKKVMDYVKNRDFVTPVTPDLIMGLQPKTTPASLEKPCVVTLVTPVTPKNTNSRKSFQTGELNPDRWCWPNSSAMNTGEIETFAKRAALFNRRGLASLDAETVADVMVTRDREGDNRNACLECRGLTGNGPYQCSPWRDAGLGGPLLARQLVTMLQRCNGFTPVADLKVKQ